MINVVSEDRHLLILLITNSGYVFYLNEENLYKNINNHNNDNNNENNNNNKKKQKNKKQQKQLFRLLFTINDRCNHVNNIWPNERNFTNFSFNSHYTTERNNMNTNLIIRKRIKNFYYLVNLNFGFSYLGFNNN